MMDFTLSLMIILSAVMVLYAVMMLFLAWHVPAEPADNGPDPVQLPTVSVIICARNEESTITECLETIVRQDYPAGRFGIIVSDDDSTDDTRRVVQEFAIRHPATSVRLIASHEGNFPGAGKKFAATRAVMASQSELIVMTDADTARNPGWLRAMARHYHQGTVKMVLGPVLLEQGSTLFTQMQAAEFMGIMGMTAASANRGHALMANGANLLFEREAFIKSGGYENNLKYRSGDDQFLLASFISHFGGRAILFCMDNRAVVRSYPEPTLNGFLNQRFRWVSKSRGYRDKLVIFSGLAAFLSVMAVWGGAFIAVAIPNLLWFPLALLAIKMSADFPLVYSMCHFYRCTTLLRIFLPAQLFQLIYVPLVGMGAWVLPYSWKGRRSKA